MDDAPEDDASSVKSIVANAAWVAALGAVKGAVGLKPEMACSGPPLLPKPGICGAWFAGDESAAEGIAFSTSGVAIGPSSDDGWYAGHGPIL